jgi:hypothetical protein
MSAETVAKYTTTKEAGTMLLVRLTCSAPFYPPNRRLRIVPLSKRRVLIRTFARGIPEAFAQYDHILGTSGATQENAVRVSIKRSHIDDGKPVDVQMVVYLTDQFWDQRRRLEAREALSKLMQKMAKDAAIDGIYLSWAFYVFFGPGHGCISSSDGSSVAEMC